MKRKPLPFVERQWFPTTDVPFTSVVAFISLRYTSLAGILEGKNVGTLFGQDPFVIHEIICMSGVHEWLIFLDARGS